MANFVRKDEDEFFWPNQNPLPYLFDQEYMEEALHVLEAERATATGYSEAKNMASLTLFKTICHVEASGHLDYLGWDGGILWFYYVFFLRLNPGHHSLLLFGTGLQFCFPVKLQQWFGDWKTSPDLPSAWGWEDNDWIFIFGWTIPLRCSGSLLFIVYKFRNVICHCPGLWHQRPCWKQVFSLLHVNPWIQCLLSKNKFSQSINQREAVRQVWKLCIWRVQPKVQTLMWFCKWFLNLHGNEAE